MASTLGVALLAAMRILGQASEAEMVLAFLRAEVDSPRFGPSARAALGNDLRLVAVAANPNDAGQNAKRHDALASYRGYGRHAFLFAGFPTHVAWQRVALDHDDFADLVYARSPEWVLLSRGSRLIRDGASAVGEADPMPDQATTASIARANGWPPQALARPKIAADVRGNVAGIKEVERELAEGRSYPELILLAELASPTHFLVEGHTRATAMCRQFPAEGEVEVLAGYASSLASWAFR
jgi:hypothetical protein